MPVVVLLWCVAALLVSALSGIAVSRRPGASQWIYGASLAACLIAFIVALWQLLADPAPAPALTLPLGLPWLGAHFRIDPLAAFFLVVVNLGGAAASLYGLGYGPHERA